MASASIRTPVVHLNGSGKKSLLEQLLNAHHAGRAFQDALIEARPNARDYYVAGDGAFSEAQAQHVARLAKVREVMDELEAIAAAVQSQGR